MFGWKFSDKPKQLRIAETSGAYDGVAAIVEHGLMIGTKVASNLGWRRVETLEPGDLVLTFDHGMQTIAHVRRTLLFTDATKVPAHLMPVTVPAGTLGYRSTLHLLPEQGVLVESDAAVDAYGDPFAIVPAAALAGFRGIHRAQTPAQIEVVTISFAQPQVIYAEGGALLYCPQTRMYLSDMFDPASQPYDMLSMEEA
jgi:hypothetical protein